MRVPPTLLLLILTFDLVGCGGKAERTTGSSEGRNEGSGQSVDNPSTVNELSDSAAPGQPVSDCVPGLAGASKVRGLLPVVELDAMTLVQLDAEHYIELVLEQFGEPCLTGGVGSACILDLTSQQTGFYPVGAEVAQALIVSKGGEHQALGYRELREFLGTVDSPNEAAVMAWSEGWSVACSDIRRLDDGYAIFDSVGCTGAEHWLYVSSDGTVSHSAHCLNL